jgi:glutamate---cysteine ligase / carboxylate-amine ligase
VRIDFTANPAPTLGVELELAVVDRATGALVNAASDLLTEMGRDQPGGEHAKAKHELFECTVELITGVCRSVAEARADLGGSLAELQGVADRRGLAVMSAGTHPWALVRDQVVSPAPRYARLVQDMQWPARRLLIFGTHVHVGVPTGEDAVAVANELMRHLPVLLALSASSPYFEGEDTGLASSRSKIFESLPTAGLPPEIRDWLDFESFMDTLMSAGCIETIREVWWDIRPHPDFGTVELRMCDAVPTLGEVTSLAALAQCLVADILDRRRRGVLGPPPRRWTVQENRWLAARHGLETDFIVAESGAKRPARDLVGELIDLLHPVAESLGCATELEGLGRIVEHGPGYLRQRRLVESGADPAGLVKALVAELESDSPADA